jgi:ATP/maltotriose-dependent transcriptional regulator MalT
MQSGNAIKLNFESLTNVINESLYGFFIEEIWDKLEQDIKEFLLKSSYLESFTPGLCKKLFGFTNSAEIIEYLLQRNIFITKHSGFAGSRTEHSFSYNDYFKQFLQNQHTKTANDEDKIANLRSIAGYFNKNSDHENAILYFLKAKCYLDALNIISEFYSSSHQIEIYKKSENWFAEIPEELLLRFPLAVYLKLD